jgi:hypothetical protein
MCIYKSEIIFASIIIAAMVYCCINLTLYIRECGSNRELSVIKLMPRHCLLLCVNIPIWLLIKELAKNSVHQSSMARTPC